MKKQTNKKNQVQEKKVKTEILLQVGTKENNEKQVIQKPIKTIKKFGKIYNIYKKEVVNV